MTNDNNGHHHHQPTTTVVSGSSASSSSSSLPPSGKKMKSTLSRGKLQFIKKSTRGTPWYDTEELLTVGDGLLTALQLFPMATTTKITGIATAALREEEEDGGGGGMKVVLGDGGKEGSRKEGEEQTISTRSGTSCSVAQQQLPLPPADCHQLRNSLHRVAVWKGGAGRGSTRISGGGESTGGAVLPHAIESTACLAGILWADASWQQGEGQRVLRRDGCDSLHYYGVISLNQLRNAYSSAIIRSVNGIADSYRRVYSNGMKTSGMSSPPPSVSHCACTLAGLPAWIVDVRHDASHGAALPSIHVCRLASLEILRYWKDTYWSKVKERVWGRGRFIGSGDEGGRSSCGMFTMAYDILAKYQTSAFLELHGTTAGARTRHAPTTPRDLTSEDGGRHHQQRNHPQPSCVENSTSCASPPPSSSLGAGMVGSASGRMAMERGKINENTKDNTEDGMILAPSLDKSNDQVNGKCVAVGPMRSDTAVLPPASTCPADKRRRQRPRHATSGGGAIPWWILTDDDVPKKKKQKKKKNSENDELVSSDNANNDDIGTASTALTPPAAIAASEMPIPTTRDCAMEFIRTIPIDVAFSTCLRVLVWGWARTVRDGLAIEVHQNYGDDQFIGGEVRYENIGPALLTLPSVFVPRRCQEAMPAPAAEAEEENEQFDSSFEYLRIMYEPLLIAMTTVYPGFAPALFVHLIDSILCLEEAGGDESHDKNQLDGRMQHLSRWVRYILSRAFHMHFDRSVAMFDSNEAVVQRLQQHHEHRHQAVIETSRQILPRFTQASSQGEELKETSPPGSILVDLKKRGRKKWNAAQFQFMQSPLDFSSLRDIGFPLNSVCDRLLLFHQQRSTITGRNATNSEVILLHQYLQDIIEEKDRILTCLGIGAPYDTVRNADSEKCSNTEEEGEQKRKDYRFGLGSKARLRCGGEEGFRTQDDDLLLLPVVSVRADNMMTLEDMEALLGREDCEDVGIESSCVYLQDKEKDTAQVPTGLMKENSLIISSWTLCKSWDACAIGTMPGYPS